MDGRAHPRSRGENPPFQRACGRPQAHPRSRGENSAQVAHVAVLAGSSPLTRGKRQEDVAVQDLKGLIPAHAGKTSGGRVGHRGRRAHPRSRGENHLVRPQRDRHVGSSPLTRGKRAPGLHTRPRRGLIPAHAGKTHCIPIVGLCIVGSSPLTRGKLVGPVLSPENRGLIPAHAGKTQLS